MDKSIYMTKRGCNTIRMDSVILNAVWKNLAHLTSEATRMTEAEAARFGDNPVAKFVGLLPFLAGCQEAQRTALAHLAIWVVANRGGARAVFDHKSADDRDPLARLESISHYLGGDRMVIEAGLRRLALCMASGYLNDKVKDDALGAYNPFSAGAWTSGILAQLDVPVPASVAEILDSTLGIETAKLGIWGN